MVNIWFHWKIMVEWDFMGWLPSGTPIGKRENYRKIICFHHGKRLHGELENHHAIDGKTHYKWAFLIAM